MNLGGGRGDEERRRGGIGGGEDEIGGGDLFNLEGREFDESGVFREP